MQYPIVPACINRNNILDHNFVVFVSNMLVRVVSNMLEILLVQSQFP